MTDEQILNKELDEVESPVKAPADFTSPEELYDELMKSIKKYRPNTDLTMIEKAYNIARKAHEGQFRKSGEPYIIHPICVAIILAELELDKETIVAGLLHDVVEDTVMTSEDVAREFGDEIALLVDGVTKLTQLNYSADKVELQAENLRKMFLAMAKDIRVVLVKLADRLHNMRTMQYQKPEKQKEKSRETLEIYSPIASRLGISKIKVELDDLSMKYLMPDVYNELVEKISLSQKEREIFINGIIKEVKMHIDNAGIEAEIDGRVKHFFSIYRKMVNQNKTLDQIYDIFAVRIRVETVKDCYAALGVIHEMYKPIPGRFKDYIAMPKQNMYQSLHTTLISSTGQPFEIQIRTHEMHRIAEYGIAAHWKYKEGGKGDSNEQAKMAWLRQILEWQKDMSDNKEFMSSVKSDLDLFSDSVYCFTPSGDVKNLPAGSTTIDFAYSIHSAVGNKMVGARVNGKLVNIDYVLKTGDRVEIITSQNSKGPSRDWLSIVKSAQARNKINQWFKQELKEDNIIKGRDLIATYCKGKNINLSEISKPEFMEKTMAKYGFRDWDSLVAAVGHGGLKESQVVNKLCEEYEKKKKKEITDQEIMASIDNGANNADRTAKVPAKKSSSGIVVKGVDDVAVRFSRCCMPVPGDEIVGFVTRGRGISIHRTDCVNIINLPESERTRLIDAEWQAESIVNDEKYSVEISIYANNRIGIIVDITKVLTERNISVTAMNCRINKQDKATILISFDVSSTEELKTLVDKIRNVEGVLDIERTRG
ncbi:MAG: bifunctional (p)ppGpp synthetase/guanosine-3',5'-bis(diphosphate) 3'-pyrophosphohydrolase [Thermoflexaceae bacterium]|nr:bifunctional (p)ppGpp synthetase/guanosine-3',5'-bis(diphosphate) 3'-pyrophosphohydrolase [Thermoflexaceae bacterium]